MPIVRSQHDSNYTTLPNSLLQDARLSCCDLGLLVQLLSRPPNWNMSTSGLNSYYQGRTGKESIAKSVKRLQEFGYLKITRERSDGGKLAAAIWTVYDTPQPGKPECGSPQPGKPGSGFPPYKKERLYEKEKAVPAFGGGEQLSEEPDLDPDFEKWMKEGNA